MYPPLTQRLAFLGLALLLVPSDAKAGGMVVTWGDTIKHLGEVADDHKPAADAAVGPGAAVGFKYSYWGLFWVDLWTWDGEYCLYRGESYQPLTPAEAAAMLDKPEGELGKPFLYRWPLGLILLTAFLAFLAVRMFLAKPLKARISPLPRDWRYFRAVAVLSGHAQRTAAAGEEDGSAGDNSFEMAVCFLADQNIPRAEAERNLARLLAGAGRLLADERYSQALAIMSAQAGIDAAAAGGMKPEKAIGPSGFDAAVRHLLGQGLSRAEAEHNLALVLHLLPVQDSSGPTPRGSQDSGG